MPFIERDWFEGKNGTKESFCIRLGEMPNGLPYLLPVMVVTGVESGPTFFVNAAMHGDEILGTEAVRQAWKLMDPQNLRGRLVMIPMASLPAVAGRTRRIELEMYPGPHDMNRIFPGNASGIITERIAATIMDRFVDAADFSFDLHSASVGGEWLGYAAIPGGDDGLDADLAKKARSLGESFGTPLLLEGQMITGSLVKEALRRGKVASMAEFGVATFSSREERVFGRQGIFNMLTQVGMLEGELTRPDDQIVVSSMHRLRTDHAGFLHRRVGIGASVEVGEALAVLMSLDGDEVAEFRSPCNGVVCRMNTMGVVGTGDLVAYVGVPQ